jgi:hypothetical protein
MKSKQVVEKSLPKRRMLKFEKESFLCENGNHDCGAVHLYRGQWFCGVCLKDAVRRDGGTSLECYAAVQKAERHMYAGNMRCTTPTVPRPSKPRPVKKIFDPDCEWCGGTGWCEGSKCRECRE